MAKIWFDITNTPQVHFLLGIKTMFDETDNEFIFTARKFAETEKLLTQKLGSDFVVIGKHYGKNRVAKSVGVINRFRQLYSLNVDYDISISCGSENAIWTSKLRNKKSIVFGDNDLAKQWTYSRFVNYSFFPNAIPLDKLIKQGIKSRNLYQYNGFKEDIYIADFNPNPNFLNLIPFDNYLIVRPENIKANYSSGTKTITPELLKLLDINGYNIIYLPRYETDYEYARGINNIYIPEQPLNGLDLCYYSMAVLTGAGTLAREAACLSVPSFSFFAGKKLLSVDKKLIGEGKIFYSRNPKEIVERISMSKKKIPDLRRSKIVKEEVKQKMIDIINKFYN